MKKLFIVAGEVSGDAIGGWYLRTLKQRDPSLVCHAVGGNELQAAGASLYAPFTDLNVTGVTEIIRHLPSLVRFLKRLVNHIITHQYDEVILVDFPGFNLKVARRLKKLAPHIRISYLCPPQLWAWGAWRLKSLCNFTDEILVLYPFEVDWYTKRHVPVRFVGNPVYQRLLPYSTHAKPESNKIALIPASRHSELNRLFPLMAGGIKQFLSTNKGMRVVIPVAESIQKEEIEKLVREHGLAESDVYCVQGKDKIYRELSTCCMALTKPGTVTLELALLGVPALVVYKTSWLTYLIARCLVSISYMALPNLLLPKPVYPEFIQAECKPERMSLALNDLYASVLAHDAHYHELKSQLKAIKKQLISP